ncbi:MAG: AMP-binding protein [Syntrophomonadaceae bacterium]
MVIAKSRLSNLIISNSKNPHKAALRLYTGEVLTYGDLIRLMSETRKALEQFHIKSYERIALITNNNLICLPVMLAIIESAVCVPLDPEMTTEQYRENYQLLGVDWLMCDRGPSLAIDAALSRGIGIITLHRPETPSLNNLRFDLVQNPHAPAARNHRDHETAFIFTTSGTTSKPKVVPMLYEALVHALEIETRFYEYTENSMQLLVVKLYRNPAIQVALKVLMANGQILYTDGINPKRMADYLLRFPVTHLNFQPAGMLALLKYCQNNSIECTHQHRLNITLTGAPLPGHLKNDIENRFQAHLIDQYGMTEVGIITSTYKAPRGYKAGSVGCPIFKEITLLDNEVLVKDFGMFPGYENSPDVNRDSFVDNWFRTGDVGYIDEDGYLFIKGRARELINRGGEKISPYEIEEAILALGSVKEAVVFPYPNKHGSDDIGVVIVPKMDEYASLREMRSVLRNQIKPYKLPTLLYRVTEIPSGSAHKIQRNLLYQQLQELNLLPETLKNAPFQEEINLTPTESTILDLWKYILDQDYIHLDDNFFDLGGDSLIAAELLAAIETSLGCVLPVNQFFRKSTVRELAELVEKTPQSSLYNHLVPIRPEGSKAPLFLIHDVHGDVVTYHNIAEHIDPERPVYGMNFSFQKEAWDASTTLTEIAHTYVEEVLQFKSAGPYYLGGLSIGGAIAFEMARLLMERKNRVVVFMLDTYSEAYMHKSQKAITSFRNVFKYGADTIRKTPPADIPQLFRQRLAPARRVVLNVLQSKEFSKDPMKLDAALSNPDKPELLKNKFLLSHVHHNYHPDYYPGKIYYFKAGKRKDANVYWQSLVRELVLIEKNCGHTDFVEPGYAEDTAREINAVLDEHEVAAGN